MYFVLLYIINVKKLRLYTILLNKILHDNILSGKKLIFFNGVCKMCITYFTIFYNT